MYGKKDLFVCVHARVHVCVCLYVHVGTSGCQKRMSEPFQTRESRTEVTGSCQSPSLGARDWTQGLRKGRMLISSSRKLFGYWWILRGVYVLEMAISCQWFINIFSQYVACIFSLLIASFMKQIFFFWILIKCNLLFSLRLVPWLLSNGCLRPSRFSLLFSSRSFLVLAFTAKSFIHLEIAFVDRERYRLVVHFLSAYGCQFIPFVERAIFCLTNYHCLSDKINLSYVYTHI